MALKIIRVAARTTEIVRQPATRKIAISAAILPSTGFWHWPAPPLEGKSPADFLFLRCAVAHDFGCPAAQLCDFKGHLPSAKKRYTEKLAQL